MLFWFGCNAKPVSHVVLKRMWNLDCGRLINGNGGIPQLKTEENTV